jgi:replicative DNA helicase
MYPFRFYGPLDVVYIDHLQEVGERGMITKKSSTADVVAAKARALRNLSHELDAAMVLLAQLNRKCESGQDKRPLLADLKDSGGVEEAADVVIFIYRDDRYNPQSKKNNIAELIISKQRDGNTGIIEQRVQKESHIWRDLNDHGRDISDEEGKHLAPPKKTMWDQISF